MKKWIALLLALLTSFSFVACGGGEEDNVVDWGPETGTISFYVAGGTVELELWDALIAGFEDENPGITVDKKLFSDYDTVYSDLGAGVAADVIQVPNSYLGNWASRGALKSIQPFIDAENFDTSVYFDAIIPMFSYSSKTKKRGEGDLYALPKDFGIIGVYVNLDIVNNAVKNGLITEAEKTKLLDKENPLTYDEYAELAHKLTIVKKGVTTQYGSSAINCESYLWGLGTDLIKDEKYFNADDPKVHQVYQYVSDMMDKDSEIYCAPSIDDMTSQDSGSMFMSGKIAMYWAGRWTAPGYDAAKMNYCVIPIPVAEKGDEPVTYAVSAGYAISRNCKKQGMAWKLIKYLASEKAYRTLNKLNYAVPAIKSLIDDPEFTTPVQGTPMTEADLKVFFDAAKTARRAHSDYFTSNRWIDLFNSKLDDMFLDGTMTAAQCIKDMEADINAAIKQSDPALFQ